MISWSECSIDWKDATTIGRITHNPTGAYIDLNIECDGLPNEKGKVARNEALKELNAKVQAARR